MKIKVMPQADLLNLIERVRQRHKFERPVSINLAEKIVAQCDEEIARLQELVDDHVEEPDDYYEELNEVEERWEHENEKVNLKQKQFEDRLKQKKADLARDELAFKEKIKIVKADIKLKYEHKIKCIKLRQQKKALAPSPIARKIKKLIEKKAITLKRAGYK